MLSVCPESRDAGLRCLFFIDACPYYQPLSLFLLFPHNTRELTTQHQSMGVLFQVPAVENTGYRLSLTISASALARITWSLVSQCSTWQPQCTVDDQSPRGSWSNVPKNTSTVFSLVYHLIWSRSQCRLPGQIKTMAKSAQKHYKAAGFTEWGHLTL